MCGDFETESKLSIKWLGQILSSGGLAESVAATVEAREGKIRGACLEISQIVNDWRSRAVGGMETALLLWESCCIPSLLNGAGTWTEVTSETEKKLNKTQCWFLRLIFQIGQGAPHASLLWDSGFLEMGLRIKVEKLMLVLHIRNLKENTLAKQIYEEQKKLNWPGLAAESRAICLELDIEDCNSTNMTKYDYKQIVMRACHKKNEEKLRALGRGKCERIQIEEYGKKSYLQKKNIFHVRHQYRSRFKMQPFAGNYSHDQRFKRSDWLCLCLQSREDEAHLTSGQCTVYGDLALKYSDLTDDENLVEFFREVLDRRDQLDQE